MTAPKSSERGVRRTAGGAVKRLTHDEVADLELCFAGKQASAWCLLLPGYESCKEEILERWRQWKTEHPEARPLGGHAWLLVDDPDKAKS